MSAIVNMEDDTATESPAVEKKIPVDPSEFTTNNMVPVDPSEFTSNTITTSSGGESGRPWFLKTEDIYEVVKHAASDVRVGDVVLAERAISVVDGFAMAISKNVLKMYVIYLVIYITSIYPHKHHYSYI